MASDERAKKIAKLRARLADDEWLTPGQVAFLLGVDRSTIVRMLLPDPPLLRFRKQSTPGGYREIHPDDVRALLARRDVIHGEPPTAPTDG